MSIKEMENRGVLQILLFLHIKGKTKVTDINIDASSGTIYTALSRLARLELIDEERQRPYTRYIQLTGDGKAIAKKIEEIDAVLKAKRDRQSRQAQP
jgi:DNA-binding PadR family transcriptional regulator